MLQENILCSLLTGLSPSRWDWLLCFLMELALLPLDYKVRSHFWSFLLDYRFLRDRDCVLFWATTWPANSRWPIFVTVIGTAWSNFVFYTDKLPKCCLLQFGGLQPVGFGRPYYLIMGRNGSDVFFLPLMKGTGKKDCIFFSPWLRRNQNST